MTEPAKLKPLTDAPDNSLARRDPLASLIPQPKELAITPDTPLRYIDAPADPKPSEKIEKAKGKDAAVLRGLKDLQQLQKQTIAVLETLQSSLEDIHKVLRSPEATRGLEKQKNAATLLAKGFAHEAVEQARDAAQLLPAAPEAQLLLALSLASDHQLDPALAATRKGLALIDRRNHPLAIEAGLLHALASLGSVAEAVDRWALIVDSLPLPVLLEQIPTIAACFPNTQDLPPSESTNLDTLLATRITRGCFRNAPAPRVERIIDTRPSEIPAPALLAGLDAAKQFSLTLSHRSLLVLFAQRLNALRDPTELVKYISECIVPLGNRNEKSASSLSRVAVKRLLRSHADAQTLHRALVKLQMAGAATASRRLALLLYHWRHIGKRALRQRQMLTAAVMLILVGAAHFAWIVFGLDALHGKQAALPLPFQLHVNALYAGPALILLGILLGLTRLLSRAWQVNLPNHRPPLTPTEIRFLQSTPVRQTLRQLLRKQSI